MAFQRHRFWNCWLCNLSGAAVNGQSQRRRKSALLQPSRARQPYRALIRPVCPVARHEERESSKGRQEGALIWTNVAACNFLGTFSDFYPLVIFVLLVIFLTLSFSSFGDIYQWKCWIFKHPQQNSITFLGIALQSSTRL